MWHKEYTKGYTVYATCALKGTSALTRPMGPSQADPNPALFTSDRFDRFAFEALGISRVQTARIWK